MANGSESEFRAIDRVPEPGTYVYRLVGVERDGYEVITADREITVSALREWMAELGAASRVAVSGYGKIKTIAQMVALVLLVYRSPLFGLPIYEIGLVLLYVAAVLTLVSMLQYLISAWPKLRETAPKQ